MPEKGTKEKLERIAVKEAKVFLKTVSDGLRALSKGVELLARQVESLAEAKADAAKPASKPARKRAKAPKAAAVRQTQPQAATGRVWALMQQADGPVTADGLAEKSGLERRQVQNILYRLKKQGKIKAAANGGYTRV